jgi:peptide/nickel transport system substrate-binding protein
VIRYVKGRSVKGGSAAEQAANRADVIAGRADVIRLFADEATKKPLYARYSRQLHEQVRFDTQYLTLNVRIPPFDQLGPRQAINYALDRRKFAEFGVTAAHPTCQVLPPGFPGHISYCPYAGADFAPNVARAKSLVAASGTAGMTVDVYGEDGEQQQRQYVASVLRDIGYRPVTHVFMGTIGGYLHFIGEPSHRAQVAISPGWIPDDPRPDAYFDFILSCRPDTQLNNSGHYCRPDVDDLVAHAKSTQLTDPPAALALWSQIDRRIVDDAPIVPTMNSVMIVFTSARVGNVQMTPQVVFLIEQMWVK